MEELIFIGVLVVFSILEALSRGKKGRGPTVPPPDQWEWEEEEPEPEPEPEPVPSARREPTLPQQTRAEYRPPQAQRQRAREEARSRERTTSREIVPEELWEEILGTARRGTGEVLRPPPPVPPSPRPVRTPAPRPAPAPTAPVHAVHLTHREYGTDPSSRSDSGVTAVVTTRPLPASASAARALLRGRGDSLRQAMILKEVLGPPAALSGDWPVPEVD